MPAMRVHEGVPAPYGLNAKDAEHGRWLIRMLARGALTALAFFLLVLWAWIIGIMTYMF
jgi:hypothetical protein